MKRDEKNCWNKNSKCICILCHCSRIIKDSLHDRRRSRDSRVDFTLDHFPGIPEFLCHKNIERHTARTIVSWPNPKQWVIVHTSDLMMIIRQSIYPLRIINTYHHQVHYTTNSSFLEIWQLKVQFSHASRRTASWAFAMKLLSGSCHRTSLTSSLGWFRKYFASRHQAMGLLPDL